MNCDDELNSTKMMMVSFVQRTFGLYFVLLTFCSRDLKWQKIVPVYDFTYVLYIYGQ